MSGVIWSTIRIAAAPSIATMTVMSGAIQRVGQEPQRFRGIIDDERDVALFGFSGHSCAGVFRVAMY